MNTPSPAPDSISNSRHQDIREEAASEPGKVNSEESLFGPHLSSENRTRGFLGGRGNVPVLTTNLNSVLNSVSSLHPQIPQSSESTANVQVFWGTSINVEDVREKFKQFLYYFKIKDERGKEKAYYLDLINEIKDTRVYFLNIDARHIQKYDPKFYWHLIQYPTEMIPLMDTIVTEVYNSLSPDIDEVVRVRVRNLSSLDRLRDLGPRDVDRLVQVSGVVVRVGEDQPEMREGCFRCAVCRRLERSQLNHGIITEPTDCPNCHTKSSYELIHNFSLFNDKQIIKLQETPESMPEGETPVTIHLCAYDELVDFVKPGDRCEFVGIYRAQGIRVNPRNRATKSTFRTFLDVINITKSNKLRLNIDNEEDEKNIREYNEENRYGQNDLDDIYKKSIKSQIEELKHNPNIYQICVNSFAPSIWENEYIKKGLLLQLFGGTSKDFTRQGQGKFRGDINVLLIGDPSTAKSQLLQCVHSLSPRGIFTSGKGSSVVGLTASVSRDPETGEVLLESGALVLSDRGVCCIDEFDKMDEGTRVILHEAMEQQSISVAKAGIICSLNARTAILASANPIHSRYDKNLSVIQNIRLPPSLLSRFDLIYLMLDQHNEAYDRRLANHIVSMYTEHDSDIEDNQENKGDNKSHAKKSPSKKQKSKKSPSKMEIDEEEQSIPEKTQISRELLMAYISEARRHEPKMSDEASKMLINSYIKMRETGSKNTVSATPRQLESMIRLSEARAKVRFSEYIEKEDVEEAVNLIKVALQQAATDPLTGVIDMNIISTGISESSKKKITEIANFVKVVLRDLEEVARKGIKVNELNSYVKRKINNENANLIFSEFEFRDALRTLEDDGIVSVYGNKKSPSIRVIAIDI